MKMNVGIIGCNGFIGKHLSLAISKIDNINLKLFGRSSENKTGLDLPYENIDFSDKENLKQKIENLDIIYYLASTTIPATSWDKPIFEIESNLIPFLNLVDLASKIGVKKVVFTSSAGTIYGSSNDKLKEIDDKHPFSPYGITKLSMELYLNYYKVKNDLNYDVFRISNIYGEDQDTSKGLGIINTFLENIINHKDINIYGKGDIVRNYIYIKDVVDFLLTSLDIKNDTSNIYNLASDDNLSINNLLTVIDSIVDEDYNLTYLHHRNSDNPNIYIDNSKIKNSFPEKKFTPIHKGIKSCYEYLKKSN
ncbi:NAD-dependent epimerase/dehydratase family protein [Flavobacterium sp. NRK F10]|uniref:NAD-dependent epimerase/dehydratase domain-containing protein n=1 Tax=Flavobacterium sediminis TaxID=2201181 RepID=A0A2U8QUX7_9FLAO|nr:MULTISPECIES: NAD-dependent epimerase/dehydratase family protein [Flavobacterium]AWM13664.1 hypothetical protein DI487_07170 [Flavobacterium sediminis]MCO6174787.1 NAD-dependent epimerase/dehydratase family protein [Flavobacterium sp. NRK F10]